VVKKKKKGKQKQKQGVPAKAGPPTSPGGTPRPGLQVDNKPDLDETDELDAAKGRPEDAESSQREHVSSPGMEEARQWEQHDVTPVNVSPKYDIEEDEFRNVWGGGSGEQSGRQKHL